MVKVGDKIMLKESAGKNPVNRPYLNKKLTVENVVMHGLGVETKESPLTFWWNEFKVVKKQYA